ncbi:MAG: hypothetical protein AAGN35_19680 [Bacteroidota bacterium]
MKRFLLPALALFVLLSGCKDKDEPSTSNVLRVKLAFDPTQERLDNLGNPSTIPPGNAAQNPTVRGLSAHFIELVPTEFTPYQGGETVYQGLDVPADNANSFGFTTAADFDQAIVRASGETFIEVPLSDLGPGTYNHVRVSVIYQNGDVVYNLKNIPQVGDLNGQTGTIASFVGYNNFITNLTVNNLGLTVNDERLQGFWAFETNLSSPYQQYNQVYSGQAPENATTVVNPFPNAPVPQGSCVVSGSLDQPLEITGQETSDIELTLSFSINQSFEWEDTNANGEWDLDIGGNTLEPVVDMGLRGLIGKVVY